MFEGFKTGNYDLRTEGDPTRWATGYDFPALTQGRIVKEEVPQRTPQGMNGFVFNTRRRSSRTRGCARGSPRCSTSKWVNANLLFGLFPARRPPISTGPTSLARGRPRQRRGARAARALRRTRSCRRLMDGTWEAAEGNHSDGSGARKNLRE